MKKDTRFSIRKLTVGVASIAVASFLASGTVDAANLSILDSRMDEEGHNPELPFESFPPSISYTRPEAPWMQGSLDTEAPGDDVEEVTEPRDPNYVNPEAPFTPAAEANYENPEAPFAPAPVFTEAEAPFAGREVEVEDEPEFTEAEAPFAGREVEVEEDPVFTEAEAPFAGREVEVEEEPEVTEAEAPFAGREVEVEEEPEFTEAEAPFAGREVEVEEEPEFTEAEAPFAGREVEVEEEPEFTEAEAPFAGREVEVEEETPETEDDDDTSIPGTIIEPGYKKTLVDIEYPAPSEEASENVATTRSAIENELKDVSTIYAAALTTIINNEGNTQRTRDHYVPYRDGAQNDEGQTILADFLDHYRKAKEDETITLEQLVLDSVGKKGGIYETLTVTAAEKLGFNGVEEGQDPSYYRRAMANNQFLYKAIMATTGEFGYYAPRSAAQEAVNKVYADMTDLLNAGTAAYRTVTGNTEATPNDALAAGLDYYRTVADKPEATLKDVVEELAQFGFNTNGALELAKQYAKDATKLGDVTEHYKETMGEKIYKYIQDETGKILEGIGEGN